MRESASLKMKSLFVLTFLLCISVGYSLKCYQCLSTKSWDDCDSVKKEVTCSLSAQDRCGKADVSGKSDGTSVTVYAKDCAVSSACSHTSDLCKSDDPSVEITDCEVFCCEGDLCNGAKVQVVSAIMLLACALVAFLF